MNERRYARALPDGSIRLVSANEWQEVRRWCGYVVRPSTVNPFARAMEAEPAAVPRQVLEPSASLRRWFGRSAVADEHGRPLPVFHGTDAGFDEFRPRKGIAAWFTSSPEFAAAHLKCRHAQHLLEVPWREMPDAPSGLHVVPVFLRIERPFDISAILGPMEEPLTEDRATRLRKELEIGLDAMADALGDGLEQTGFYVCAARAAKAGPVIRALKRRGYDGLRAEEAGAVTWAPFDPRQVKSVFNHGAFDATDANILR